MKSVHKHIATVSLLLIALLHCNFLAGQSYNSTAAANYADNWATNGTSQGSSYDGSDPYYHNPAYPRYTTASGSGVDCANFVSQCLRAGGLDLKAGGGVVDSWGNIINCDYLHTFLKNYSYNGTGTNYVRQTSGYPSWFTRGDVVIWGNASDRWMHTGINVVTGTPAINAHTSNRYHRPISFFYPSGSWSSADFYHIPATAPNTPPTITLTMPSSSIGNTTIRCGGSDEIIITVNNNGVGNQDNIEVIYMGLAGQPEYTNENESQASDWWNGTQWVSLRGNAPKRAQANQWYWIPSTCAAWEGKWVKIIAKNTLNGSWSTPKYVRVVSSSANVESLRPIITAPTNNMYTIPEYHIGDAINVSIDGRGYVGNGTWDAWDKNVSVIYACLSGNPQYTNSDETVYNNHKYGMYHTTTSNQYTFTPEDPAVWENRYVKIIAYNAAFSTWSEPRYIKVVPFKITASSGSNGSISPSGSVDVSYGSSKTFTFTPNNCYEISQVLVNGVANTTAKANGYHTFSNVTANQTISVTFAQKSYSITASAGSGGSISPNGTTNVNCGSNQTYTFTPNNCYEINQVLVNDVANSTAKANGYHTFSNVTANQTISVIFTQKQFSISASAGSGGSISPSGTTNVNCGSNQTYTFTPNSGYQINQVLVNGVANSTAKANGYYTFSNVTATHAISVSFSQLPPSTYIITATADNGGSISPNGLVNVISGDSKTFAFTPNSCYEINQVLVNGTANSTAKANGYYTFSNVTANHTIEVTFTQKSYFITASAGNGGSISPSGTATVNCGSNKTYAFTPNSGCEIDQVKIDNVENMTAKANGYYTFSNVTSNQAISVTFKQVNNPTTYYIISASAGENGNITPSGNISVNQGGSQTFVFVPNNGYEIHLVLVDGSLDATAKVNGYYTFSNVSANHEILVTFTTTSGVNDVIANQLQIFPNPAQNELFIKSDLQIKQVEIYSLTGSLLLSENNFDGKISVSALSQGVYLLKVYTDKGVSVSKIVKE